jgi:primosomal protein N' (replication factor Y)
MIDKKHKADSVYYFNVAPLLVIGGSKSSVFTYFSTKKLIIGDFVQINFRKKNTLGLITARTEKPQFKTLPINDVLPYKLPKQLLGLALWLSDYYATPLGTALQAMLPKNILAISKIKKDTGIKYKTNINNQPKIILNSSQQKVLSIIKKSNSRSYLLHGVTGSGKTQIYIELIKSRLKAGQSSIVLVPEISLTPQIMHFFQSELKNKVLVTHSGLSRVTRKEIWKQIYESSEPLVIVGPRSALFMPVKNLGLIVIDESHENTYKQEQSPRYHAPIVAAKLCQITGAKLILGSATPSAVDWYLASRGKLELLELPLPVFTGTKNVQLVDLRDKSSLKNSYFISSTLIKHLQDSLKKGKQSIIFINRRGSARLLLCPDCGWSANCPRCHIPLTFHADKGRLLCHWCNFSAPTPARCPILEGGCGNMNLRFIGAGTKRLEQELTKLLPGSRIARLDKDSFKPQNIKALFDDLKSGQIDILVGTQMVTKGLDLENMETIGIILADSMLRLPDFTATERTFQLLHQVAGRAGRRQDSLANVVIQTYSPEHPVIEAAVNSDYHTFIKNELEDRKLLNYPPYTYLLKLSFAKNNQKSAQVAATKLVAKLRTQYAVSGIQHVKDTKYRNSIEVLGPAPAFHETYAGKYHWQIIVKAKNRDLLVAIAKDLPAGWVHDLDPIDLL